MPKRKYHLSFCCLLLACLLAACSAASQSADSVGADAPAVSLEKYPTEMAYKGGEATLQKVRQLPIMTESTSQGISFIFNGQILMYAQDGEYENLYLCDLDSDGIPAYITKQPTLTLAAGSPVMVNRNEIWESQGKTVTGEGGMETFKTDLRNRRCETVFCEDVWPPFRYWYKVSDRQLVYYNPRKLREEGDKEIFAYEIGTLDTQTAQKTNLLTFTNEGEDGVAVPCATYANDLIYVLIEEKKGGYHLSLYTLDGTWQRDIPFPRENSYEPILRITVRDNYLFCRMLSSAPVTVLRLDADGTAIDMDWKAEGYVLSSGDPDADTLYFYNEEEKSIGIYDPKTKSFVFHALRDEISGETTHIYPIVSQEGELYFSTDSANVREWTIPAIDIYRVVFS